MAAGLATSSQQALPSSSALQDILDSLAPLQPPDKSIETSSRGQDGLDADPASSRSGFSNRNLLSLDEWESENPYVLPSPKLVAVPSETSTGVNTTKFYNACIARGVTPTLICNESPPFKCTVRIGDKSFGFKGAYASKKLAKDRVCEQLLRQWSEADHAASEERQGLGSASSKVPKEALHEENWIGILQDYTQSKNLPLPTYSEFQTQGLVPRFAFEVNFSSGPPTPFRTDEVFSAKKDAKQTAAREAVLWLRRHEEMLDSPHVKRSKTGHASLTEDSTVLTQATQDVDVGAADGDMAGTTESISVAQRVHELAVSLGFQPPTVPIIARDGVFVTVAARFAEQDRRREQRLKGDEHGHVVYVEGVKGQKAAKERCRQEVLGLLEQIKHGGVAR